jgi:hypothetical protein
MSTATDARRARPVTLALTWTLRLIAVAGLVVDAYVHADLAARYDLNKGSSWISQGDLFRVEAVVAVIAAIALLFSTRTVVWLFAAVVASSALFALVLYLHYDAAIGPLPNMYEPVLYPEKTLAAVAEGIAAAAAAAGFIQRIVRRRTAP